MPGLLNRMFTRASNSVGIPSIVNEIWEKTLGSSTVGSDTLNSWTRRRSDGQVQGKWRTVRRPGQTARISGPFDSETGLELGDREGTSPEDRGIADVHGSVDSRATPDTLASTDWHEAGIPDVHGPYDVRSTTDTRRSRDEYGSHSIEHHV